MKILLTLLVFVSLSGCATTRQGAPSSCLEQCDRVQMWGATVCNIGGIVTAGGGGPYGADALNGCYDRLEQNYSYCLRRCR